MGRCAEQAESSRWAIPTGTVKYQDLLCTEAEKGTAAIKGYGSDRMMSRIPSCGTKDKSGDGRTSCLTLVYGNSANSQPINIIYTSQFWLILPEVTAIEVRLSHASRM